MESGKPAEAIPYFKRAIQNVEARRASLESEEFRSSFFDHTRSTYAGIIKALLSVGNIGESFDYSERARSRAFLDILGSKLELVRGPLLEEERSLQAKISLLQAKLSEDDEADEEDDETDVMEEVPKEDKTQLRQELNAAQKAYKDFLAKIRKENKEQASLMNVEPLTIKEVQERLAPGITLIEYFVTNDAVVVWVVEKDAIHSVGIAVPRKELRTQSVLYPGNHHQTWR